MRGVFVTDKLFISTRLGGALKISNIYRTITQVNYPFQAESARYNLFQKYFSPPPGNLIVAPLFVFSVMYVTRVSLKIILNSRAFEKITTL